MQGEDQGGEVSVARMWFQVVKGTQFLHSSSYTSLYVLGCFPEPSEGELGA